jgi:AcrR family transcriptional regulator
MPPTRPQLQREEKIAEILETAERRLLEGGFEALSMAGVARDLGLAQNAVYWYFPSRAELFVAVLRRIFEDIAARKPRQGRSVVERVLWFTDQFAPVYEFWPALQEQTRESAVVANFVKDLDALFERMLGNLFRGRVPDGELGAAIATFRATITGTYAQGLSRGRRRELLAYSLNRLLDGNRREGGD